MATDLPYYYNGAVTTDAGSYTASSPLVSPINLGSIWLWSIRVRMPPGPCGNLYYAFYNADAQIIPYLPDDSWVIGDDEIWEWDYNQEVGIQFALWTYNTGNYNHELLFEVNYTPVSAVSSTPVSVGSTGPTASSALLPQPNVFQAIGDSVGS